MLLSVDSGTTVVVSRDPDEPECEVCYVDGSTPNCSPTEKTLTNVEKLSLEFSCLKPQDVYSVKIRKKIGENCGGHANMYFNYQQNLRLPILNYTLKSHVWKTKQ